MAIELPICYCGAKTKLEQIMNYRAAFLGKDPLKHTYYRVVCTNSECNEGVFNLFGQPSKQKAIEHFLENKRIHLEVAEKVED